VPEVGRKLLLAAGDAFLEFHDVFLVERRVPHCHFIYQAAKRPEVDCESVALARKYFGRELLLGPAECVGVAVVVDVVFAQSEVSHFYVARTVEQNVFGFKVALHYFVFVQLLESQYDLSRVLAGALDGEAAMRRDV